MSVLKGFGKRLRDARIAADFPTQETLAKRLGVSRAAVSWWEAEKDTPHPDKWDQIARLVKRPVAELFLGVSAVVPSNYAEFSPQELNLLRLFARLDDDGRDEVMSIVRSVHAQQFPEGEAAKTTRYRRVEDVQPAAMERKKKLP